jgi:hypothetical protein
MSQSFLSGPGVARADLLHNFARAYVLNGLGTGNFESVPYSDDVTLRAPLCPGGANLPLAGKAALREQWWAPLPRLVAGVEVIDTYVNRELTAVTVEFHCQIREPACTLRVVDRFTVDDHGRIIEQENFFDPRDVTNPGWQKGVHQ